MGTAPKTPDSGHTDLSAQSLRPGAVSPPSNDDKVVARDSVIQMDRLLDAVIQRGASDLHLIVGKKPTMRLHGELVEVDTVRLTDKDMVSCIRQITPERHQIELHEKKSADFSYEVGRTRFRANACHELGGIKISMRRLPETLLTLEQIGLPTRLEQLLQSKRGLILVTGETGSGKTTTLASMVNHIATTSARTIVTIEQPIEYRLQHGKSLIMQREVGQHVPDFKSGLRDALRQDPEIIMVGELRDLETIRVALTAAETGHLVFGTLHTNSAPQTINRLIDVFPEGERDQVRTQVSMTLLAILCQQLIERKEGGGRIAAMEFMTNNSAVANHIRQAHPEHIISAIQTGAKEGMFPFDDHLIKLVSAGKISKESALEYAHRPKDVAARLQTSGGERRGNT